MVIPRGGGGWVCSSELWYVANPCACDGARADGQQTHRQETPGYSISEISLVTRRYSPRADAHEVHMVNDGFGPAAAEEAEREAVSF